MIITVVNFIYHNTFLMIFNLLRYRYLTNDQIQNIVLSNCIRLCRVSENELPDLNYHKIDTFFLHIRLKIIELWKCKIIQHGQFAALVVFFLNKHPATTVTHQTTIRLCLDSSFQVLSIRSDHLCPKFWCYVY